MILDFEQLEQDKEKALANKAQKAAKAKAKAEGVARKKGGRPKGSKNKDKVAIAKE